MLEEYLRVAINKEPHGSVGIWFMAKQNGKWTTAKPVELEFEEVAEGMITRPTLNLDPHEADIFMQMIAQELEDKGIQTKNVHHIEGELGATKLHLDDMRKLVFKEE